MISIIVPVYNVQQYIDRCISSLVGQTYIDIEIILVDDGSTDQSGRICDEYAAKDDRIKVFHVDNGGQSRARNIGISQSSGEYIGFIDSDDWAEPTMYERLLNTALENMADIVESNFEGRHSKAPEEEDLSNMSIIIMTGHEAIERQLNYRINSQYPGTALWPKLFSRTIIEGISLPNGKIHEEYAFLTEAFLRCNKYVYLNEILYHRTIRDDSTTGVAFSKRDLDKIDVFKARNAFLKEHQEEYLYQLSKEQEYILLLHMYGESFAAGMRDEKNRLKQMIFDEKTNILHSDIDKNRKIKYMLFFVNPYLYGYLYTREK